MKGISQGILGWLSDAFTSTGSWDLFAKLMVIVALLFIALAVFVRLGLSGRTYRNPAWRHLLRYAFLHGLIIGFVGLLLGFFRYEQVLYLAAPWVLYLYLLFCLVWAGWIARELYRITGTLELQKESERKQQWIKAGSRKRKKR